MNRPEVPRPPAPMARHRGRYDARTDPVRGDVGSRSRAVDRRSTETAPMSSIWRSTSRSCSRTLGPEMRRDRRGGGGRDPGPGGGRRGPAPTMMRSVPHALVWRGDEHEGSRRDRHALLTLRGTPVLYYGDEIGMAEVAVPRDEDRGPRRHPRLARRARDATPGRDPDAVVGRAERRLHATRGVETVATRSATCRPANVAGQRDDAGSVLHLTPRPDRPASRHRTTYAHGSYAKRSKPLTASGRGAGGAEHLVALNHHGLGRWRWWSVDGRGPV